MLIQNAEIYGFGLADLRTYGAAIADIGQLAALPGEAVLDAAGGALLPGLHDHHIHLSALAARRASLWCGPPAVTTAEDLAGVLAAAPGTGWLRGIGYHESVMGLPNARELDHLLPDRPLRIQHRSGRMWLLNSAGLELALAGAPPPAGLERDGSGYTGRLFDEDNWLRSALASSPPDLTEVSRELAQCGVTGLTEMSPRNDPTMAAHYAAQRRAGALAQGCLLAGTLELAHAAQQGWTLGPAKLHLHEAALPDFDETLAFVVAAHRQGRGVAIHCVSEVELVYALAALETAGVQPGDRIEHASVASDELIARIGALGIAVVVQPHFITERGDQYLTDVEPRHHAELYRLRSFLHAGVVLAGGSDAPFGSADPWQAMAAAVARRTPSGVIMREDEALSPEQALALYLADPLDMSRQRRIEVGATADLCLLRCAWTEARGNLSADNVRATVIAGRLVNDGIDQPPVQRLPGVQPLA
jgi:predicted amidohydrolase YtcJ